MLIRRRPRSRQRGFNLIELMIAMTLGLLIMLGVLQVFMASRSSYSASVAAAQAQETGRFALELLKPHLRAAGTHGFCGGALAITSHLNTACAGGVDQIYAAGRPLTGWEFDGTGASNSYTMATLSPSGVQATKWKSQQGGGVTLNLPGMLGNQVVPGTDVVIVRTLEPVPDVTAAGNTPANAAAINLTAAHGTSPNSLLLVTNCTDAADFFQNGSAQNATALNRASGSCTNPGPGNVSPGGRSWSTRYDQRMQIYRARMHAYYVGVDSAGEPGLYRHDITTGVLSTDRNVLAEGVENMQLRYGLSKPGSGGGDGQSVNYWVTADRVTDWNLVIAVHVSLLVRSRDASGSQAAQETINMAGTTIRTLQDNRLRRRFNATVALRNRVIVL